MTSRRRTTISVLSTAVMTSAVLATGVGTASAEDDAPGCSTGQLPNVVMGSPDVKPGQALGLYLWHGSNGYSLRATHPGHAKVLFAGRLRAANGLRNVTRVKFEKADLLKVRSGHKQLTFRFTNYGYIDGIN